MLIGSKNPTSPGIENNIAGSSLYENVSNRLKNTLTAPNLPFFARWSRHISSFSSHILTDCRRNLVSCEGQYHLGCRIRCCNRKQCTVKALSRQSFNDFTAELGPFSLYARYTGQRSAKFSKFKNSWKKFEKSYGYNFFAQMIRPIRRIC